MRAELETDRNFIESVQLRNGYAVYSHVEQDPQGNIGTTFSDQGKEGRAELVQVVRSAWDGALGAQLVTRDFDAVGDEAFVQRIENSPVSTTKPNYDRGFTSLSARRRGFRGYRCAPG